MFMSDVFVFTSGYEKGGQAKLIRNFVSRYMKSSCKNYESKYFGIVSGETFQMVFAGDAHHRLVL